MGMVTHLLLMEVVAYLAINMSDLIFLPFNRIIE